MWLPEVGAGSVLETVRKPRWEREVGRVASSLKAITSKSSESWKVSCYSLPFAHGIDASIWGAEAPTLLPTSFMVLSAAKFKADGGCFDAELSELAPQFQDLRSLLPDCFTKGLPIIFDDAETRHREFLCIS